MVAYRIIVSAPGPFGTRTNGVFEFIGWSLANGVQGLRA